MVRLHQLSLTGFRSFDGAHNTVTFPSHGLVLLAGTNHDTGGSSGSGKSSVNLAIAYVLGYCPYPATELASWNNPKELKVELSLDIGQERITLRRTSSGLQMWVRGEAVKGGSKVVNETLRKHLGLESEMLGVLTYRGQKQPGLFLSKTDSEKKEFLTQLLGLDKFELATEASQARAKDLELQLVRSEEAVQHKRDMADMNRHHAKPEAVAAELATSEGYLKELAETRDATKLKIKELRDQCDKNVLEVERGFAQQISDAQKAVTAILRPLDLVDDREEVRLTGLLTECNRRWSALVEVDKQRAQTDRNTLRGLQERLNECSAQVAELPHLRKEQQRLVNELAVMGEASCPTCEQPWTEAGSHREEVEKQLHLVYADINECIRANEQFVELTAQLQALPAFEADPMIAKLQAVKSDVDAKLAVERQRQQGVTKLVRAEYESRVASAHARLSQLKNEENSAAMVAGKWPTTAAVELTRSVEEATMTIMELTGRVAGLRERLQQAEYAAEQVKKWEAVGQELAAAHAVLLAQVAAEKDFLGLIGREGFLGSIFDEVLDEITTETNQILASVANTRHVTFVFRSESTTQKGTIKRSIVPVVAMNGHEAPIQSGLSGGMQSTVELAVDLAVGAVISRRSGSCPGWLILDECFEGLDTVSKESCMEILSTYARDRLVIVTDHATEMKSLFSKTIHVRHQYGKSTFQE